MKQAEKLDLILRELYKYKHDGKYYSLTHICHQLNIELAPHTEISTLGHRLKSDMLINAQFRYNDVVACLTTYGIDYCEGDSYTFSGHAIITNTYNNISVTNSPNANVVSNSSNVSISIANYGDIKNKIDEIRQASKSISHSSEKEQLLECLEEVETSIEAGKKPKYSFSSLTDIASNLAGVGSLVIELGKLIFGG